MGESLMMMHLPAPHSMSTLRETKRVVAGGLLGCDYGVVQVEHMLHVYVDDIEIMQIVCTPDHLVELAMGRLYSEGFVAGVSDVQNIYLSEDGTKIYFTMKDQCNVSLWKRSCVTTSHGESNLNFPTDPDLLPIMPIAWDPKDVFAIAKTFAADTPMHKTTLGTHSCHLSLGGEVLYCCEDLGRHNAFDKVIGRALIDGVDLTRTTVFSSGRMPADMIRKVIRARVPIMVSKAVPTDRAVDVSKHYKLTLICSARPDSFIVFSDPLGCVNSLQIDPTSLE